MKKLLKIAGYSLLALLLLMFLLPFVFKNQIRTRVQQEINRSLTATVSLDKVGLSLFRNFPDFTLNIGHLRIVGKEAFAGDTLIDLPEGRFTVDLMSVIKGKNYVVKDVFLSKPAILLKALKDGSVNWDITKPSTDTASSATSPFRVELQKIVLEGANFVYDDASMPFRMEIKGLTSKLKGNMDADVTDLDLTADCDALTMVYGGIPYFQKVKTKLDTRLKADLAHWVFTFNEGKLRLNDLDVIADGSFGMPEKGYDMDIRFKAANNSFKSFLSLIPAIYAKDFGQLKAEGNLSLSGFVKGHYEEENLPAFGLKIAVANGNFAYPSLPGKVADVQMNADISSPGGIADATVVDVSRLHLNFAGSPLDATLHLAHPVSDPDLKASAKGKLNLADVSTIYPLDAATKLAGIIDADIQLAGRLSAIEKQAYGQFQASGYANLSGIEYSGAEIKMPLKVNSARLDVSPANIKVDMQSVRIGKSDLTANGLISSYLPYFLKKEGVLTAAVKTTSSHLDLNELMGIAPTDSKSGSNATASGPIEIPDKLNLTLNSRFDEVLYSSYSMKNVNGALRVKDKAIWMDNLDLDMLGGSFLLKGSYTTQAPKPPVADLRISVNNLRVAEAAKSFESFRKYVPIAEKITGALHADLSVVSTLKADMSPELTQVSAKGLMLSDLLGISGVNALSGIADALKMEKLRNPSIEKVNLSFDVLDGKVNVKPMDFKFGGYKANFSGNTGLDQKLNFILNLEIPRAEFGQKANEVLQSMLSKAATAGIKVNPGDIIPVTILIGGTATDPKITTGIKQALSSLAEDLKQQAVAEIQKKKEEVIQKGKEEVSNLIEQADARAAKLLSEAETQGQKLLDAGRLAADKARQLSDSTASRLVDEASKNGPIAALAARKAAEKVRKEGNAKADRLMAEAQAQKDALMGKARAEADKIKQDANDQVNKVH